MEYNKISDTEVEVSETIIKTSIITLDKLLYDRDSLQRTIDANLQQNIEIQSLIDELDNKITQIKGLGVVSESAISENVI